VQHGLDEGRCESLLRTVALDRLDAQSQLGPQHAPGSLSPFRWQAESRSGRKTRRSREVHVSGSSSDPGLVTSSSGAIVKSSASFCPAGPVAQLDRASASEAEGRRFEFCLGHHSPHPPRAFSSPQNARSRECCGRSSQVAPPGEWISQGCALRVPHPGALGPIAPVRFAGRVGSSQAVGGLGVRRLAKGNATCAPSIGHQVVTRRGGA
jgi:hypothetical protein